MQAAFKFILRPLKKVISNLSKVSSTGSEKDIRAAERKLVSAREQEDRYVQYLNNPGAIVEWRDIIEVVYT